MENQDPAFKINKDKVKITEFRAIEVNIPASVMKELGFFKTLWGTDIFINDIPMIKLMILANIIVWNLIIYFT